MKKIVSLVIALIMLQTTALANATEGFAKLWKDYSDLKSFKGATVMSATVNEPLLILEDIPPEDGIDYPLMINDLLSSTATADYSVNISEDYKKMQMAMSVAYDVPISLNEDFKVETWTRMGMWLDFDITNPDAPVYKLIMKVPFESKYQVIDMISEYEGDITEVINPDIISEMSEIMLEVIKKNGKITQTKNGYRVKFDNDGVIGYIADVFEVAKNLVPEEADIYDEIITAVESARGNLSILGEDGLILDFTTNARGDITAYIEAIHFDFNLYDIANLLDLDTDGLVREHADINITFKAATEISGHNKTVVDMPELTEENSEDMYGGYDYNSAYYESEESPLFKNNCKYYPLDEISKFTGVDYAPIYVGGVLTLVNENGSTITVSDTTITMDGEEWRLEKQQVVDNDGRIYVTDEVLGMIGCSAYTEYNMDTHRFIFTFYYYGTDILYPYVEEPVIENEEPDVPQYFYEYVSTDQVPYVEDDEAFIPVYDLFREMYQGEFDITMESLDYTATDENRYGIEKISVKVGENSIMVDNEEITFEKPVVNVANIFRAPLEFVDKLGFDLEYIYVGTYGTSYSLSMPNPNYIAE